MKKTSGAAGKLKLWSIDVCPTHDEPGMTIVLMATSLQQALRRAERRYPQHFVEGRRGHAIEADHAAYQWRDKSFEAVRAGAWWGTGYLPTGSRTRRKGNG